MSTHGTGLHGHNGGATPRILPGSRRDDLPTDRLPPHNLEAEEHLLSALVIDPDALPKVRAILRGPDDFYRAFHQEIYQAIADLADRGDGVDGVILWEELRRRGHLTQEAQDLIRLGEILQKAPSSCNAAYHAAIVRAKAIQRDLIDAASADLDEAYSQSYTAEQLLERSAQRRARVEEQAEPEQEGLGLAPWPDTPDPAVWQGLAGDIVARIEPHTEADPMAILGQFLVAFGNLAGRNPNWRVEATRHSLNLFLCVVGATANARKGTSWDQVERVLAGCDPDWMKDGHGGGLVSGEGLIHAIRDPLYRREKGGGDPTRGGGFHEVLVDPGVDDKRVLWVENEFSSLLSVQGREGNILSEVIRKAWDGKVLRSAAKNNPSRASNPHVSIIGHITGEELQRKLSLNDVANGYANRFLWVCARRSKILPHGGQAHRINWQDIQARLQEALAFAAADPGLGGGLTLVRDDEANRIWEREYRRLTAGTPGMLGAITSRGAAQVMRVAAIYALLDCSIFIRAEHLRAGLAFWDYCEQSARFLFGDGETGNSPLAKLLEAIRAAEEAGLTSSQIQRRVFKSHWKAARIKPLLASLVRSGLVRVVTSTPDGGGKPATIWKAALD